MRFSVIIPTYNRSTRIEGAINSVLSQRFGDFECVVVDDGSTDDTRQRVEAIVARDSRIQYLWQRNAERGAARNFGVSKALGEYVYFLDSDDLLTDDHLSHAQELLSRYDDPAWMHSRFERIDDSGRSLGKQSYPADPERALPIRNFVGSYYFVRRDIAAELPFIEDRTFSMAEDWYLALCLLARHPLRLTERITRKVVVHDAQSMNASAAVFSTAECHLVTHLRRDVPFMRRFGEAGVRSVRAEMRSLGALAMALEGRIVLAASKQSEACALRPRLVFERRTLAVLKHIALQSISRLKRSSGY